MKSSFHPVFFGIITLSVLIIPLFIVLFAVVAPNSLQDSHDVIGLLFFVLLEVFLSFMVVTRLVSLTILPEQIIVHSLLGKRYIPLQYITSIAGSSAFPPKNRTRTSLFSYIKLREYHLYADRKRLLTIRMNLYSNGQDIIKLLQTYTSLPIQKKE